MTEGVALTAGAGRSKRPRTALYAGLALAIVALTAAILLSMGRTPLCTCGTVELWHGTVNDSGNSQHLSDWYSASHAIHDFLLANDNAANLLAHTVKNADGILQRGLSCHRFSVNR